MDSSSPIFYECRLIQFLGWIHLSDCDYCKTDSNSEWANESNPVRYSQYPKNVRANPIITHIHKWMIILPYVKISLPNGTFNWGDAKANGVVLRIFFNVSFAWIYYHTIKVCQSSTYRSILFTSSVKYLRMSFYIPYTSSILVERFC